MTEANLLKGTLISTPQPWNYGKYKLTLVEKHNDSPYTVMITGVPFNSVLIKLDESKIDVSGFFGRESNNGINQKADYILIDNESHKILFIELKSGTSLDHKHIKQQLTGAKCLFEYMRCLMEEFFNVNQPFNQYSFKYFAIAHQHSKKRCSHTSREEQRTMGSTADKFRIIQMSNKIRYDTSFK